METKVKNKHKFNFVDAILIAVALIAIAAVAFIFFFDGASMIGNLFGSKKNVEIYYAVELSYVREDVGADIKPGDKVTDAVKNYDIGTVVGTLEGDSEFIGYDKDGKAIATNNPGYKSVIVIIKAEAANTGYDYSIDGYTLQTGDAVSFTTPGITGTGYCIGLEEVKDDAAKEAFWQSTASKVYYAEVLATEAPEATEPEEPAAPETEE